MGYLALSSLRVDQECLQWLLEPSKEKLQELVQDIQKRGILCPLLVTKDGLLLNGHRRLQAAEQAGMKEVPVKVLDFTGKDNWKEAVNVAVHRFYRELTTAQRADLGCSLLRLERQKGKERQREGQRLGGKTGGRGRRRRVGEKQGQSTDVGLATQRAAKTVGISRKTLERYKAVKERDPETAREVLTGNLTITAAYKRIRVAGRGETPDHGGPSQTGEAREATNNRGD